MHDIPVLLPDEGHSAPTESERQRARQIIAGFHGTLPPKVVPAYYRLGLILVAAMLVLLPLLYVSLVGAVGYGVYYHAVTNTHLLTGDHSSRTHRSRGSAKGAVVAYFGPIVIGIILIGLMVKPLFARDAQPGTERKLRREDEPVFFDVVDHLCGVVGCAPPKEIIVDHQVNASASFCPGVWDFLTGRLRLTVGLPLAAGLTLPQFVGVLGHEFGHFTQRGGMSMTNAIISFINNWLTRVVHGRDQWDEWLAQASGAGIGVFVVIAWGARAMVWLTRKFLWCLMTIGKAVSCFLLRQMEYDADRVEALLVGTDTFAGAMQRFPFLTVAANYAQNTLNETLSDNHLADDYPAMVQLSVGRLTSDDIAQIQKTVNDDTTGFFSTHPAAKDRMKRVAESAPAGIFVPALPGQTGATKAAGAAVLFRDFGDLCRRYTRELYREVYGERTPPVTLCPTGEIARRHEIEVLSAQAFHRYFQATANPLRALPLPAAMPAAASTCDATLLVAARERMWQMKAAYLESFRQYDEHDTHLLQAEQAHLLLTAGFAIEAKTFNLPAATAEAVSSARDTAARAMGDLEEALAPFELTAAGRIVLALSLLQHPDVARRVPDSDRLISEARTLLPVLATLRNRLPAAVALRNRLAAAHILFVNIGSDAKAAAKEASSNSITSLYAALVEEQAALDTVPFPLDYGGGSVSLFRYLVPEMPSDNGATTAVLQAANTYTNAGMTVRLRLLGHLAAIAEQTEDALGLERWLEPQSVPDAPAAE